MYISYMNKIFNELSSLNKEVPPRSKKKKKKKKKN